MSPAMLSQVKQAVAILKHGGVVAYPTDTIYGLGAVMNDQTAVQRIFEIKDRPKGMALPLLLSDVSQISLVSKNVPHAAALLAAAFFPGALTIILEKSPAVPDI
ncbi:MAG: Sua5/YciO/YrdC/YwlC family protein, partial [Dehalococcoidales bacterium]|nr:Sua5/YciO/YrdC/YwlC family protein [Dehalococcoidales bacterium]